MRPAALPLAALVLLAAFHLWCLADFAAWDQRLPDGDAMGHLGAIEVLRWTLAEHGAAAAVRDAFTSTSEYPPLHPLLAAFGLAPLHPEGPFPAGVWAVDAAVFLATLLGVYLLGRHRGAAVGLLAAALWSLSPLAFSLARHPMPEPWVALWLVWATLAAEASRGLRRFGPTALLGLCLAGGLLTKQTFALYAAPVVAGALARGLRRASPLRVGGGVALLALVTLPGPLGWLATHWADQQTYLFGSAGSRSEAPGWHHLVYYPLALVSQGLGPFVAACGVLALGIGLGRRGKITGGLARWGWVGAVGLLTMVPKKYPRLLVPVLPLLAVDIAETLDRAWGGLSPRARRLVGGVCALCLGGAWAQAAALGPLPGPWTAALTPPVPSLVRALDPNCYQDWIRPPHRGDLGLDAIFRMLEEATPPHLRRSGPPEGLSALVILDQPELPCGYQTTFDLAQHLGPYLRRRGLEVGEVVVAEADPERLARSLSGGGVRGVVSSAPWVCPPPPEGDPEGARALLCSHREAYRDGGRFVSTDPELPFTWYLYPSISP